MRYRVTEGGLELSATARGALGEFSCRARRVTSLLIMREDDWERGCNKVNGFFWLERQR